MSSSTRISRAKVCYHRDMEPDRPIPGHRRTFSYDEALAIFPTVRDLTTGAVRQVEVGLASLVSLVLGLTVTLYGAALLADHTYPKWIGGLAVIGGVPTAVAGVVMAYTGFSGLAMAINMPASSVLLVWMLALGVCMWRRPK